MSIITGKAGTFGVFNGESQSKWKSCTSKGWKCSHGQSSGTFYKPYSHPIPPGLSKNVLLLIPHYIIVVLTCGVLCVKTFLLFQAIKKDFMLNIKLINLS